MKTGEIASLLGVSDKTIRNWVERFENFLSAEAKRVGSRQSAFTEEDIVILATIKELSAEGLSYDAINERLVSGYRTENPGTASFAIDRRVVPAAAVEQIIDSTAIKIELEQVKSERDRLLTVVEKQQIQEKELREELNRLQDKIAELMLRLGKAEGRLEELDKSKKRRWFSGE